MNIESIERKLERLGHWEKLEDLSARLGLPHIPEYELEYFKTLYDEELRELLEALQARKDSKASAAELALRGRLRRVLGDRAGAARDLTAALDADPECASAHAWLAELDWGGPGFEEGLSRALRADPELACAYLYRAAGRLCAGHYEPARADLERLVGLAPERALGYLLLGLAEEGLGRRERAVKAYLAAAERNPVCSAAYLLASRVSGSPSEQARLFRAAYNVSPVLGFITLQIDRTDRVESPAYVRRIRDFAFRHPEKVGAYYRREATQSHFSHFPAEDYGFVSRLVAANPGLAWAQAFFGRAACYTASGANEGVARLTRAIELAPYCGWFYAWRANARRILGQNREALADFASAIRLQPFYHRTFVWRGSLYRKLGRLQEALSDLDRGAAMDPYYSLTFYERSMTLRGLGDFVAAALDLDRAFLLDHRYSWVFKTGREATAEEFRAGLKELDRAVKENPHVVSLRVWRGQLKLQGRDLPGAFEDFEAATQLDPFHALAHAWYGYGLLQAGQPEEAVERIKRALNIEPRLWIAYSWLAQAEHRCGRARAAAGRLDFVLRRKPSTPWAHFLRAQFALEGRRAAQACRHLERALLLDGKYPEAYLLLAQAKLACADVRGAARAAEKCLEIAPNIGRAYVVRAAVRQRQRRLPEAIADYRRALSDFPYLFNEDQRREMGALLASLETRTRAGAPLARG